MKTTQLFPYFKPVTLQDEFIIRNFVNRLTPYSDFNFISMWSYNTKKDLQYSFLNENLVLLIRDYIDETMVLTFIGNHKPSHTIQALLDYSLQKLNKPELVLIPEYNIAGNKKLLKKTFHIHHDRANYDYILSVSRLNELAGHQFANKRNKIIRFKKEFPQACFKSIDLTLKQNQAQLIAVFRKWGDSRQRKDIKHEKQALKRLLHDCHHLKLLCYGVFLNDHLEAFTINELLPRKFAITHFTKADPAKIGVFEFLYHELAKQLLAKGVLYLNREQDLGLEGLRAAKMSWRPIKFLKKYTISKHE